MGIEKYRIILAAKAITKIKPLRYVNNLSSPIASIVRIPPGDLYF